MSHTSGGAVESGRRSTSPGSLKRKRGESLDISHSRASPNEPSKSARLTNGATSLVDPSLHNNIASASGSSAKPYTSPDSDEMQPSDPGDLLRGVGSASSLNSAASSVFSHSSQAFAHNRNASTVNGLTPLTNHTESSPLKGNSPQHMKSIMEVSNINGVVATSHTPASDIAPSEPPHLQKERPQMLPPPGKAKGYRVVWDPELDVKLSKEERKRATSRKKEFGTEVRNTFRYLLSLHNVIHIT
jgi:[histone H3]-lysine4 N-trimethyltransferase SETD1